jgi:hypothetical protein
LPGRKNDGLWAAGHRSETVRERKKRGPFQTDGTLRRAQGDVGSAKEDVYTCAAVDRIRGRSGGASAAGPVQKKGASSAARASLKGFLCLRHTPGTMAGCATRVVGSSLTVAVLMRRAVIGNAGTFGIGLDRPANGKGAGRSRPMAPSKGARRGRTGKEGCSDLCRVGQVAGVGHGLAQTGAPDRGTSFKSEFTQVQASDGQ